MTVQSQMATGSLSLTFKDALDLAMKAGDKIDADWRQYFTVVFALLAYVSSNLTNIHVPEALIVSAGIIFFSVFNAVALIRQYILISLLADEARVLALKTPFASAHVQRFVDNRTYTFKFPLRKTICFVAHALASVAIIYLASRDVPVKEWNSFFAAILSIWP